MKKQKIEKIKTDELSFNNLTNRSKRKVYYEVKRRYNNNEVSPMVKFNYDRDIKILSPMLFNFHAHLFYGHKLKAYIK